MEDLILEKLNIMRFVIGGQGIHNLPMSGIHVLTKEWLIKYYNVELDYFKRP